MSFNILIIWNILVFLVYGLDKMLAIMDRYRISEKTLLTITFLLGGIGALFGMEVFRHKTKKPKFKALAYLSFLITSGAIYYLIK